MPAWLLPASASAAGGHDGVPGAQHVPAGERVGDGALRADPRGRVGLVDPPDQNLKLIKRRACLGE